MELFFYHGAIPWLPVLTDTPMSYVNYFIMAILSMSVPVFFFVNGFLIFGKNFDMKRHIKKQFIYLIHLRIHIVLLLFIFVLVDWHMDIKIRLLYGLKIREQKLPCIVWLWIFAAFLPLVWCIQTSLIGRGILCGMVRLQFLHCVVLWVFLW